MCPVASPAGADQALERFGEPGGFSRVAACHALGFAPSALHRWEGHFAADAGLTLPDRLTFSELLALAVASEAQRRIGDRAFDFTAGLGQVFTLLAARGNLEQLDSFAVLVGRDFARLTELPSDHIRCPDNSFLVVPLAPLLAIFRDQVFP
jgi:hypothetical protein